MIHYCFFRVYLGSFVRSYQCLWLPSLYVHSMTGITRTYHDANNLFSKARQNTKQTSPNQNQQPPPHNQQTTMQNKRSPMQNQQSRTEPPVDSVQSIRRNRTLKAQRIVFERGGAKKKGKLQLLKVVKTLIRGGRGGGVLYTVPITSISLLISFLSFQFLIMDGPTSCTFTFVYVNLRKMVAERKSVGWGCPPPSMIRAYT